jgi:hypothetical protein
MKSWKTSVAMTGAILAVVVIVILAMSGQARWTSERLTSPQSRRRGAADASSCGPGGGLV